MDIQTVASLAGPVPTVLAVLRSWAKTLTLHSRGKTQIHRADELRRLGMTTAAEFHDKNAKEFLVRDHVMAERAVWGPLAPADIKGGGLALLCGALVLVFPGQLLLLPPALALGAASFVVLFRDGRAIDRECRDRAEQEIATSGHPRSRPNPWSVVAVGAWLTLLTMLRRSR